MRDWVADSPVNLAGEGRPTSSPMGFYGAMLKETKRLGQTLGSAERESEIRAGYRSR
jgi:hypothetical protein